MIRTIQPFDLLRVPLWRGGGMCDHSFTMERLGRPTLASPPLPSIAREQVLGARFSRLWVASDSRSVQGLAQARQRSGPRAWEVSHLWAREGAETAVEDLLEQAAVCAGERGARRVFLRVREDDSVLAAAIRAGYAPAWDETLYQARGPIPTVPAEGQGSVRMPQSADDQRLFRLFCSTMPHAARIASGLTIDEWRDGREPVGMTGAEWVYERLSGEVAGVAAVRGSGHRACVWMLATEDAVGPLFSQVLGNSAQSVYLDIPDFCIHAHAEATGSGWPLVARYTVLVKPVVVPVREVLLAPASV